MFALIFRTSSRQFNRLCISDVVSGGVHAYVSRVKLEISVGEHHEAGGGAPDDLLLVLLHLQETLYKATINIETFSQKAVLRIRCLFDSWIRDG
jgi:hypothetical protein